MADIHETAIVGSGADIGKGVTVGPFSYIEDGSVIGDGSIIGPRVSILRHTTLGPCCEVHSGAVLGDTPQDTGFEGGESFLTVGANCTIREGVTLHRGTREGSATEIGDKCFLMAFSHCAHNVRLGKGVIVANGALLGGYVEVGDGAFISGNCLIHQFVKIGRLVMLGGGCGVSKDAPPFCLLAPMQINTVAGLNLVGLKRAGVSPAERKDIKAAFRTLYRSGLNAGDAERAIRESFPDGPVREMADFIERSERGICSM